MECYTLTTRDGDEFTCSGPNAKKYACLYILFHWGDVVKIRDNQSSDELMHSEIETS